MARRYISVTDTAKLLRAALKAEFPDVKFSVRSSKYAGGASIDIAWTDGPTSAQVKVVGDRFEGSTFDGMTDMKSYHDSDLNGETVHFGADFVFEHRKESDYVGLRDRALAHLRERCVLEDDGKRWGSRWVDDVARSVVWAIDFRDPNGYEKAFNRVVLNKEV